MLIGVQRQRRSIRYGEWLRQRTGMHDDECFRWARERDIELAQARRAPLVDDQRGLDDDDVIELEALSTRAASAPGRHLVETFHPSAATAAGERGPITARRPSSYGPPPAAPSARRGRRSGTTDELRRIASLTVRERSARRRARSGRAAGVRRSMISPGDAVGMAELLDRHARRRRGRTAAGSCQRPVDDGACRLRDVAEDRQRAVDRATRDR